MVLIDERKVKVKKIGGMYRGELRRKEKIEEYGLRMK